MFDGLHYLLNLAFLVARQHEVVEGHLDLLGCEDVHEVQHLAVLVLVEVLLQQGVYPDAVRLDGAVLVAGRRVAHVDAGVVLVDVRQRRVRGDLFDVDAVCQPLLGHLRLCQREFPGELLVLGKEQVGDCVPRVLDAGRLPGGRLRRGQRSFDLAVRPEHLSIPGRQVVLV